MHEASLAAGVLKMVEDAALQDPFESVLLLRLEAGQLSGVDAEALRFCLEALSPGTLLEGAHIHIEQPAGQAWCMMCATQVTIKQRGDACPHCQGYRLTPTGGMDLRIVDLRVKD